MILILGVTASGKGSLAFELAKYLDAEIISIDSMKVYRRMNIGTAKPSTEKRSRIPYHLIDIVEPSDSFSVGSFLQLAQETIAQITARGKKIVAVGGTALYIKALLYGLFEGPGSNPEIRDELDRQAQTLGLEALHKKLSALDPAAATKIHPNDRKRIFRALEVYELTNKPISSFQNQFDSPAPLSGWTIIGLRREKDSESRRINLRVKMMIEAGLVDEVKSLLAEPLPLSMQAASAIGYAEIIDHLKGNTPLEDAVEQIKINTRRFAKHQRTWFRRFPNINWLDISEDTAPDQIFSAAKQILNL